MKLKNSINKVFFLAFFFFNQISNLNADNHVIDIWKKVDNKEKNLTENNSSVTEKSQPAPETSGLFEAALNKQGEQNIINSNLITDNEKKEVYGLYDPETNNFTLQMWSNTDGNSIKEMFKKINQKDLSDFSEKIFLETILTHSYLPYDSMTDEEFLNLKLGWLINHNKIEILEQFLNKNKEFPGKEKVIRYLVDESLSEANLKRSCEKVAFLSNSVKDFYLDKFRVFCLISENKLSEAQVTFDLLNEQYAKADKNFNEKISFALGLTETKNDKIYDDNMLNFFISSKISEKFNYKPTNKTDPYIWKYMNNAGLIQVDNIEDLTEIEKIEIAAAEEKISDDKVFEIYKKIILDRKVASNKPNQIEKNKYENTKREKFDKKSTFSEKTTKRENKTTLNLSSNTQKNNKDDTLFKSRMFEKTDNTSNMPLFENYLQFKIKHIEPILFGVITLIYDKFIVLEDNQKSEFLKALKFKLGIELDKKDLYNKFNYNNNNLLPTSKFT